MDAFFDVIRLAITKPFTASCPARLTRAGFRFESKNLKGVMLSGLEFSFLMIFRLLNSIDLINPAMTRLYRHELSLLQCVRWLHF